MFPVSWKKQRPSDSISQLLKEESGYFFNRSTINSLKARDYSLVFYVCFPPPTFMILPDYELIS